MGTLHSTFPTLGPNQVSELVRQRSLQQSGGILVSSPVLDEIIMDALFQEVLPHRSANLSWKLLVVGLDTKTKKTLKPHHTKPKKTSDQAKGRAVQAKVKE